MPITPAIPPITEADIFHIFKLSNFAAPGVNNHTVYTFPEGYIYTLISITSFTNPGTATYLQIRVKDVSGEYNLRLSGALVALQEISVEAPVICKGGDEIISEINQTSATATLRSTLHFTRRPL